MARRSRRATRPARREAGPVRAAAPAEAQRDATRDSAREGQRPRARGRVVRPGVSRAVGQPSAALERVALLERGFVVKDARRLAITVFAMLALLAASGFAVNALIP